MNVPDEITQRRKFSTIQIIVGLTVPAIYSGLLTSFKFSAPGFYEAVYWLGLPAISFFVLARLSLTFREGKFRVSRTGMWGAAIAAYIAFVIPAIFLWFTTGAYYHGGGANIGVALLVAALPLYLPIFMVVGFVIGEG
jgi:hypothetical protein